MMQVLRHLREFLTNDVVEKMQFNLRILTSQNVLFLSVWEKDERGVQKSIIRVFTSDGTYIGTIKEPEYIPD